MLLDAPPLRRRFLLLAATTGFLLLGARLAFCSSTRRRDDDATTTQRRRDGSTRGAGGGPLQPIASSATVLGPRSLGGYRVLTRRARELPRGVTSHPKDTGMTSGQDVRRNKHAPQDDHSYAAPLGLRVLPVAISHGDPPGARPPEKRGRTGALCDSAGSYSGYEVCEGAPPTVEVEWWRRTSQEELTVESEAVTGREP